jgi:carbamoyltransferase
VKILGIWDGHDSGAALLVDNRIVAAVNEERLTRRKLEIGFPVHSIRACCDLGRVRGDEIDLVACSTSDLAKALARLVPSTAEAYYRIRRRKAAPSRLSGLQKRAKYHITGWPPNGVTCALSGVLLERAARAAGLSRARIRI